MGDTTPRGQGYIPARVAQRAYERVDVDAAGCWITRFSRSAGYGKLSWSEGDGKKVNAWAHRASWTHVHGPIPPGLTVDHICKVRACVNPDHLRLLSLFENSRRTRGDDFPIGQCKNGHSDENLVEHRRGDRISRTCGLCFKASHKRRNARRGLRADRG